jgi:AsmA protein
VALGVVAGPAAAVIPLIEQGQKTEGEDPCNPTEAPPAPAPAAPKKP